VSVPTTHLVHVCVGGPDRVIVLASGRRVRFEDHAVFGPTPLDRAGNVAHLGPRHAFWEAVTRWYQGGKRLDANGVCVWEPEPDPLAGAVHLGGRHWATPTLAAHLRAKLAASEPKPDGAR
jgi:hypothetical protein